MSKFYAKLPLYPAEKIIFFNFFAYSLYQTAKIVYNI